MTMGKWTQFEDASPIIKMVIFQLAMLVFRGCRFYFYLVFFSLHPIQPTAARPWHTYGGESLQEHFSKELLSKHGDLVDLVRESRVSKHVNWWFPSSPKAQESKII